MIQILMRLERLTMERRKWLWPKNRESLPEASIKSVQKSKYLNKTKIKKKKRETANKNQKSAVKNWAKHISL